MQTSLFLMHGFSFSILSFWCGVDCPHKASQAQRQQTARPSARSSWNQVVILRLTATFCGFSYCKRSHSTLNKQPKHRGSRRNTNRWPNISLGYPMSLVFCTCTNCQPFVHEARAGQDEWHYSMKTVEARDHEASQTSGSVVARPARCKFCWPATQRIKQLCIYARQRAGEKNASKLPPALLKWPRGRCCQASPLEHPCWVLNCSIPRRHWITRHPIHDQMLSLWRRKSAWA